MSKLKAEGSVGLKEVTSRYLWGKDISGVRQCIRYGHAVFKRLETWLSQMHIL